MKYFVLVPDGAGDYPVKELGDKTPLEAAVITNIDKVAAHGRVGMVKTIPAGVAPGSDAANLSVMGYDPSIYLTGRSPLEAVSIGVDMSDTDVSFRANIITLEGEGDYEDLTIKDHSAGEISTEEADELIKAVNEAFSNENIRFYTGVSYRHCMIVKNGSTNYDLTPPHDVLEQKVGPNLPRGEGSEFITEMMKKSYEILNHHPINEARRAKGLRPANSLWIWGQGTKPRLSPFTQKYHLTGSVISAVDLIKGIAICAGLDSIDVPGVTANINTNYEGKAQAAIDEFKRGKEFVYVHVEAPDECGHQGDPADKVESMQRIDRRIFKAVLDYLKNCGEEYRILVVPDHRTPIAVRTHTSEPVPFVMYDSRYDTPEDVSKQFNESSGEASGFVFGNGYEMADFFFGDKWFE